MFKSLSSKIISSYALVILISLFLVSFLFFRFLTSYAIKSKSRELTSQALLLSRFLGRERLQKNLIVNRGKVISFGSKFLKARLILLGPYGETTFDTQASPFKRSLELDLPSLYKGQVVQKQIFLPQLGTRVLIVGAPLIKDGDFDGAVILITPLRDLAKAQRPLLTLLLWSALISFTFSILVGLYLSLSISRPLQRLTKASLQVAQGKFDQKVEVLSSDEVGQLARTFNFMAQMLKKTYQMQKDFLANVAHELRTPLTSIEGFSQALLDGVTRGEEEAKKALLIINEESKRLIRLIKKFLALATIDAGKIQLTLRDVEIRELFARISEKFESIAREKKILFQVELGKEVNRVFSDEDRLEQVLSNLLDNAFKYTPEGGRVILRAFPGRLREVKIQVEDSGIGISPEHLPYIFNRFYCVDKSRSKKAGGAGLGLAISKEMIEALGGKIEVISEVGKGTVFTVSLPTI